jgi:hypothetical protein
MAFTIAGGEALSSIARKEGKQILTAEVSEKSEE